MAKKKNSPGSKKSDVADDTQNAVNLYEWISNGYAVEPLYEIMRGGDQKKIDLAFKDFSERIANLEELALKLEELGFNEKHEMFQQVSGKLNDPMEVEFLDDFIASLQTAPKLKELKAELASLNTSGFEEEANRLKVLLDEGGKDIEAIEADIGRLKKKIKEKFFENAFEEAAIPVAQPQDKFIAETIFLLHKDGTLLSVKSKKPPAELDKKLMSRMVMAIKEQMNRAYKEGEHVHTLTYEGHTIILEDSVHVYAAVVVVGEAKPVMYKIILKALQIMEKKLEKELGEWKGNRGSLENLDKYTTAIFQALDKLN